MGPAARLSDNDPMHKAVMDSADAGSQLLLAIEPLVRFVRRAATAGGLSTTASATLGRLGREGPQRLTDLARSEAVSQPAMTQLISRLERDGLVRRGANADDRRGVLVEATEAGLKLAERRRGERAGALQVMFDALAPGDREAIVAALPALSRLVPVDEDGAPSYAGERPRTGVR